MSEKLKVGIKFCGHCNPYMSTHEVYRKIVQKAEIEHWLSFVSMDSLDMEVLIIISGCPVDCADRDTKVYQNIVVAGESVNREDCPAKEIPDKVIKVLKKIYNNKK